MSDLVFDRMVFDRLRELGDQSQRVGELEREIERLRLTDAEREAIERAAREADQWEDDEPVPHQHAATLRGVLDRLGGER